jgi:hypothetical protein
LLHKDEEGREFMLTEFNLRVSQLKLQERQNAIANFQALLRDTFPARHELNGDSNWKQAKKFAQGDRRYTALGSSSMREKLFEEFLMTNFLSSPGNKRGLVK